MRENYGLADKSRKIIAGQDGQEETWEEVSWYSPISVVL